MIRFLRVSAPFAAFRPLNAGWYRPTALMITPSAAYGLILNFAAIDSRLKETDKDHDGKTPASLTKPDLPLARIAIGVPCEEADVNVQFPLVQSMLQQLHNYPVGKDAGVPREWTKGNKNNISPVRRELLSDIDIVIGVEADEDFCARIEDGLAGKFNSYRYGLPFLGDNSFLIDSVKVSDTAPCCVWYESADADRPTERSRQHLATRLTISVDRAGVSKTRSNVFVPSTATTMEPPKSAWVETSL